MCLQQYFLFPKSESGGKPQNHRDESADGAPWIEIASARFPFLKHFYHEESPPISESRKRQRVGPGNFFSALTQNRKSKILSRSCCYSYPSCLHGWQQWPNPIFHTTRRKHKHEERFGNSERETNEEQEKKPRKSSPLHRSQSESIHISTFECVRAV